MEDLQEQIKETEKKLQALEDAQKKEAAEKKDGKESKEEKTMREKKNQLIQNVRKLFAKVKELISQWLPPEIAEKFLKVLWSMISNLTQWETTTMKVMQRIFKMMKKMLNKLKQEEEKLVRENYQNDLDNAKKSALGGLEGMKNQIQEGTEKKEKQWAVDKLEEELHAIDTNEDGSIDQNEIDEYLDKKGLSDDQKEQFQNSLEQTKEIFRDGKITTQEQKFLVNEFITLSDFAQREVETGNRSKEGSEWLVQAGTGWAMLTARVAGSLPFFNKVLDA